MWFVCLSRVSKWFATFFEPSTHSIDSTLVNNWSRIITIFKIFVLKTGIAGLKELPGCVPLNEFRIMLFIGKVNVSKDFGIYSYVLCHPTIVSFIEKKNAIKQNHRKFLYKLSRKKRIHMVEVHVLWRKRFAPIVF